MARSPKPKSVPEQPQNRVGFIMQARLTPKALEDLVGQKPVLTVADHDLSFTAEIVAAKHTPRGVEVTLEVPKEVIDLLPRDPMTSFSMGPFTARPLKGT